MTTITTSPATTQIFALAANNNEIYTNRMLELQKEWDLERVQDLNESLFELHGTLLGKILTKHYSELPISQTMRMAQEAGSNWNPPAAMFKSLGYRTKEEIEFEKNLLSNTKSVSEIDYAFPTAAVA